MRSVTTWDHIFDRLTVHAGPSPHALPALHCELAAVEVLARLRDDVPDGLGPGLEVREEARGLDVREVVLGVRTRFEDEDPQRRVGGCEPSDNYPGGCPACGRSISVLLHIETKRIYDSPPAKMMSYSSNSSGVVIPRAARVKGR